MPLVASKSKDSVSAVTECGINITEETAFVVSGTGAKILFDPSGANVVVSTLGRNGTYTASMIGEYCVSFPEGCNSYGDVYTFATVAPDNDDHEIITSSWLCDDGGTDTWVRTITPYINGVAGVEQIIDSGVSCLDTPPTDTELIQRELSLCNASGQWSITHVFDSSDLATPIGSVYYDPDGNLSSDPGDLVECGVRVDTPGIAIFNGTTPASGFPSIVESITIIIYQGTVDVNSVTLPAGSTYTWGQGTMGTLDVSAFTFVGTSVASQYTLHWEEV